MIALFGFYNIVLTGQWCFLQNPRSRFHQLHWTALSRSPQASSPLLMSTWVFSTTLMQSYILIIPASQIKCYFPTMNMTMWLAMEPWYVLIWWRFHCNGLYHPRIKLPMPSSDSSAVQTALTMRSIMALGKPVVSFPFCTPTDW